jgi:hypothetical protein
MLQSVLCGKDYGLAAVVNARPMTTFAVGYHLGDFQVAYNDYMIGLGYTPADLIAVPHRLEMDPEI